MREISWIQSHIVRAPLARILCLIALLKDANDDSDARQEILNHLETSGNNLDAVIMEIIDKVGVTGDCTSLCQDFLIENIPEPVALRLKNLV